MSTFRVSLDYLPNELVNQMTGLEQRTARALFRLFNCKGKEIAYEYASITPPESWLCDQTGSSVSVISRVIKRLESLGIIKVSRRRKKDGTFTINKYWLGEAVITIFKRFIGAIKGNKNHHLTKESKLVSLKDSKDNYFGNFMSDLRKIIHKIGTGVTIEKQKS